MPKVTVLMPVYNTKEEYLRETIDSVLTQTFTDFEFLIINDASTDKRVREVVLSYADDRIVYVENEKNLGISESSNKGIALAKGEYIARQDHDDISLPTRLEKEVRYLDGHPNVGVCSCWFEMFPKKQFTKYPFKNEDIKKMLFLNGDPICHPASMIRKSVLTGNGIWYKDEYRYAEDYALWVDLAEKTDFYNLPEILFKYRWSGENASVTSGDVQRRNAFNIRLNGLKSLLGEMSEDEEKVCVKVYEKEKISSEELLIVGKLLKRTENQADKPWKKDVWRAFYKKALRLTIYDGNLLSVMGDGESLSLPYCQKAFYFVKVWLKSVL